MKLPNSSLRKIVYKQLASNFRFAAKGMAEASDVSTKLFYFSAFGGDAGRALNQVWDSELALIQVVFQSAHQTITGRLRAPDIVKLPQEYFDALDRIGTDLADLYEVEEPDTGQLHDILTRAADLIYMTTGNGYYLYLKGHLKI